VEKVLERWEAELLGQTVGMDVVILAENTTITILNIT
jgi:hypothetical protein